MTTLEQVRVMLAAGEINASDRWFADMLANRTPEAELTKAQNGWLETLVKRGGGRFQKP